MPEVLIYDLPQASDPQVSPDGRHVLYTLTRIDWATDRTTSALWRCDLDGGNAGRLTWGDGRDSGGRWSPDGRQIAFVSDRTPPSGLFVLPADGGEARLIVRHAEAVDQIAWSPDGRRLAYVVQIDPDGRRRTDCSLAQRAWTRRAPRRVTRRLDWRRTVAAASGGPSPGLRRRCRER
jgi:Tol biopolymer transport system component